MISPSQRVPVDDPLGHAENSHVIRMCEEGNDDKSDSCNNTEINNFFNEESKDDGQSERDSQVLRSYRPQGPPLAEIEEENVHGKKWFQIKINS